MLEDGNQLFLTHKRIDCWAYSNPDTYIRLCCLMALQVPIKDWQDKGITIEIQHFVKTLDFRFESSEDCNHFPVPVTRNFDGFSAYFYFFEITGRINV